MRPPLSFFACGTPKGQPRPRACRRGNVSGVYDPGTADGWKWNVRAAAKEQWNGVPFEGPLKLKAVFHMPRPKKHFQSKFPEFIRIDAPLHQIGKPDIDNLTKAVMDALTGLGVCKDDCQITQLLAMKFYSDKRSGAEIEVSEVESTPIRNNT